MRHIRPFSLFLATNHLSKKEIVTYLWLYPPIMNFKIFNNNPHSHRFPPSFPSASTMTIKNFPDVANTDPFHPTTGAGTSRPSPLPVGSACLFV